MEINPEDELIPENEAGIQTNTETVAELPDSGLAENFFEIAKKRLLDINQWHEYAGAASARFQLTDKNGKPVNRIPQKGDHFQIDLPAPGTKTGEGHDWVQLEEIQETSDSIAMLVRPAPNPLNDKEEVAHFFTDDATSSFIVKRENNRVIAGVYGRNEKPNTDQEKFSDKIRNAAVAAGAISGFSKLQWKSLVNGLVKQ